MALVLLAALVGGAWLVVWRGAERAAEAMATYPPEGRIVVVDGRRVHAVTGGTGPDLVLIHGASGNARDMTFGFMALLADRYRVTAFDRPGLGYTDRASGEVEGLWTTRAESPMEQANLLRAAARALGIERPIVLGHSYGAAVALAWALGDPEGTAAVVDVAGASMPWPGRLGRLYRLTSTVVGGAVVPPLVAAFASERQVNDAVERTFVPDPAPLGYAAHLGTGLALRAASFRANARQVNALRTALLATSALYPTIRVPVEIVHGDADTIVPLDVHSGPLSRLIPGARLTVLEGVGHMPHHTDAQAVIDAIDRAKARAGL